MWPVKQQKVVLMKLKTGALEGQQWDSPQTRNGFISGHWHFYLLIFSVFWLLLHLASVSVTAGAIPGPYRGCKGSSKPPAWNINKSHCQKVCLQTCQEHRGDSRRKAVTLGELERAVTGPKPISRNCICFFVRGGAGCTLPELNDFQQVTGMNLFDPIIRNRLYQGGLRTRHPLVGPVLMPIAVQQGQL